MAIKNKDDRDEFLNTLACEDIRDGLNGREADDETDEWSRLSAEPEPHKRKKKRRKRE